MQNNRHRRLQTVGAVHHYNDVTGTIRRNILAGNIFCRYIGRGMPFSLTNSVHSSNPLPSAGVSLVRTRTSCTHLVRNYSVVLVFSAVLRTVNINGVAPTNIGVIYMSVGPTMIAGLTSQNSLRSAKIIASINLFLDLLIGRLSHLARPRIITWAS